MSARQVEAQRWYRQAQLDLDVVNTLRSAGHYAAACFHSQQAAEKSLREHGASVRFNTYEGGHGWHADVYGRIRSGIEWLEEHTASDK